MMSVPAFDRFRGGFERLFPKPKPVSFRSSAKNNPHRELLESAKDDPVHIPNLLSLMSSWPMGINSKLKDLVLVTNERIDSIFPDQRKAEKLKSCGFAFFASACWPWAEFEELKILSYFCLWLFAWDDEVDEVTGSLNGNFESAQKYRQDTIRYVTQCLQQSQEHETQFQPASSFIRSFDAVGEALCKAYSREQREEFLQELEFYIQMVEVEHRHSLRGYHITTPEEYWRIRLGTSAVKLILAVIEFGSKVEVPRSLMNHPDMKTIIYESNYNISAINDILSLKKEIAKGATNSLIPILLVSLKSPQLAVDTAVTSVQESVNNFEMAASRLLASIPDPSPYKDDVYKYLQNCRTCCTGNLYWSLHTKRYWKDGAPYDANGGIVLKL